VDWVRDFYGTTGGWWGRAESAVRERDHHRVRLLADLTGGGPKRVLELGAGYGATAAAMARAGHAVTAVEISDRVRFADRFADDIASGSLTIVHEDFYTVALSGRFDVVCYWNGFGVGSDADQRRLLRRVAREWLTPDGTALIDISNPFVWARWDGELEHRPARPDDGYDHELYESTAFDPVTCTAVDTWWPAADPDQRISQVLRCYTPADLALLLEGTGLILTRIAAGGQTWTPQPRPGLSALLQECHEYLAVLRPEGTTADATNHTTAGATIGT
jgi:SAM-dependent methyltransferase